MRQRKRVGYREKLEPLIKGLPIVEREDRWLKVVSVATMRKEFETVKIGLRTLRTTL